MKGKVQIIETRDRGRDYGKGRKTEPHKDKQLRKNKEKLRKDMAEWL